MAEKLSCSSHCTTFSSIIGELEDLTYNNEDVCFGKYFKAVNKIGTFVLKCIFTCIYKSLETNKGTMLIRVYCTSQLKWSLAEYNRTFYQNEREILNLSPTDKNFACDISLWFKLLTKVLETYVEPMKGQIRELKNMRNAVCHENLQMDEWKLQEQLERLGNLCREILKGVQFLFPDDSKVMNKMMYQMEGNLQDLMEAKTNESDINSYLEDLNDFRTKRTSKMISEGRRELMAKYSKLKILNPCPWISDSNFSDLTVDNTFISLQLQNSGIELPMSDILKLSLLKKRFIPQLVILTGVMGAGKTSLYRYLLQEWCHQSCTITGLSAVDIVIGLEMRWLASGSLAQFLREQLLIYTSRLFNESDIIPVLQDINVLFIIDGMDESTRLGRDVLREIVTKFTNSTVIVTTRPEFTMELKKMVDDNVVLQIEGFTTENQTQFVEKVFAVKYPEKRRFLKEKRSFLAFKNSLCASLTFHLSLPLNLALLLMLWCDDYMKATVVTTTTRLYAKIYEMSQQKLTQRLESGGMGHSATLNLKVSRFLSELSSVAWNMMVNETLYVTQEHTDNLMEYCDKEGMDPIQTLSTFLNSEIKETLTSTTCQFSFTHSSNEEFLAALYVSKKAAKNGSLFPLLKNINTPRFQEVIVYITGLLKQKGVLTQPLCKEIVNVMQQCIEAKINDPLVLHRLLQEADFDSSLCEIVGNIVNKEDTWVVNSWDPLELTEAKKNLIKYTHAAPSNVLIYAQYMKKLGQCAELEDIIKLLGKMTKTRVNISLERQFHTVNEEQIDNFLLPFLRNNTLLGFMGHAGPVFMSELVNATCLETLTVRITSLDALICMSKSIKKHRKLKTFFLPSKKWFLKHLEIFLDINDFISPTDIPVLHHNMKLLVRFAKVTDEKAKWAGQVVHKMSRCYESVTLQSSHLSQKGIRQFLKAVEGVAINVLRIMSDKFNETENSCNTIGRRGTRVEVGFL